MNDRKPDREIQNFCGMIRRDGAAIAVTTSGGVVVPVNILDVRPNHVEVFELGVRVTNRMEDMD